MGAKNTRDWIDRSELSVSELKHAAIELLQKEIRTEDPPWEFLMLELEILEELLKETDNRLYEHYKNTGTNMENDVDISNITTPDPKNTLPIHRGFQKLLDVYRIKHILENKLVPFAR